MCRVGEAVPNRAIMKRRIAIALCAAPAAYALTVVGYAVANANDYMSATPQFIRYFVGPLAIASALMIVALRSKVNTALQVGVYALAVLAAFFAHEALAQYRVFNSLNKTIDAFDTSALASAGPAMPPRATIRMLNEAAGTDQLSSAILSGIPDTEVYLCDRPDVGRLTYRADRYGFNNRDAVYDAPKLDVALIGDSFMEGLCLAPGDDVAGVLRSKGYAAASLGMRGNGPLVELASLGRFGPTLRPATTVYVYYAGNDHKNLENEAVEPWLLAGLQDGADYGPAQLTPSQMKTATAAVEQFWRRHGPLPASYRDRAARNFFALVQTWAALGLHYPAVEEPQPLLGDVVARLQTLTASWDGDLIAVYVPRAERFRGVFPHGFVHDRERRAIVGMFTATGAEVIDLAEAFSGARAAGTYYAADGHFSEAGAAALADLIAAAVDDRQADGV